MGQGPGTGLYQQSVGVAVVAACELDNPVACSDAARKPNGTHGRFRPGVDQTHFFERGDPLAQFFRHLGFQWMRRAEADTLIHCIFDPLEHGRVGMSDDHRPPGANVVDVGTILHIVEIGSLAALHEYWRSADRPESTDRRVDTSGDLAAGRIKPTGISHFPGTGERLPGWRKRCPAARRFRCRPRVGQRRPGSGAPHYPR